MAKTVQELIDEAKEKEALFKTAKKGMREESLQNVKNYLKKGLTSKVSSSVKKQDAKISAVARKAINIVAPKGSIANVLTGEKKKKSGRGRGRPSGTYKVRYLPSGRPVKVPTKIYKKMVSAEKAQRRLIQAQRMAQAQAQADQYAMSQDPRFQSGMEDSFLAEQDPMHEMNVMRAQQEAEMQQYAPERPLQQQKSQGMVQKFINGLSNMGGSLSARRQPTMFDQYGRPAPVQSDMFQIRSPVQDMRPAQPHVTAISQKANLLRVPNSFNNPGQSEILFNRNRRGYR